MSVTLATAAQIVWSAYEPDRPLPAGIAWVGPRYDRETVQARVYHDSARDTTGIAVEGTNREPSFLQDWVRNLDIRPVSRFGYYVAGGWLKGATPLAEWAFQAGATEFLGHSKGAAEALIAAFLLERDSRARGDEAQIRIQALALASPKPFFGTPPPMDALCLRNPDDLVSSLPPLPGWRTPGSTIVMPYEPPDPGHDHRIDLLIAALLRSGHGYLALTDERFDEPSVTKARSRGAAMAGASPEPPDARGGRGDSTQSLGPG